MNPLHCVEASVKVEEIYLLRFTLVSIYQLSLSAFLRTSENSSQTDSQNSDGFLVVQSFAMLEKDPSSIIINQLLIN